MWRTPKTQTTPGFLDTDVAIAKGNHTGVISGQFHPQDEFFDLFEVINSDDDGGPKEWKDCQHYKRTTSLPPGSWRFQTIYSVNADDDDKWWEYTTRSRSYFWNSLGGPSGRGSVVYGNWDFPVNGLPVLCYFDETEKAVVPIPPYEMNTWSGGALQALLPGIRPRLSLLNSIYELKDFKSLPRTLSNIANLGRSLLKGKNWGRQTLRRLLHASADGYLQEEFNVAPLLSDIAAIKSAIDGVRSEIQKLLDNEGKRQRKHYASSYNGYTSKTDRNTSSDLPAYFGLPGSEVIQVRKVAYPLARLVASIEFSYDLDPWERENALWRGYLDALGVTVNPQIIWNAIPWTFVVDWVVGVSQFLGQFKLRNIEPRTRIHKYMVSAHVQRTIDTEFSLHTKFGDNDPDPVPMVNIVEDAYIRLNRDADLIRWFTTSGVSSHEFTLAAALVASRK